MVKSTRLPELQRRTMIRRLDMILAARNKSIWPRSTVGRSEMRQSVAFPSVNVKSSAVILRRPIRAPGCG